MILWILEKTCGAKMKVHSEIYLLLQQNRLAGMLSMHVDTNVPSFARSFQDVACKVSENKVRIFIIKHIPKTLGISVGVLIEIILYELYI